LGASVVHLWLAVASGMSRSAPHLGAAMIVRFIRIMVYEFVIRENVGRVTCQNVQPAKRDSTLIERFAEASGY
jgi:hypothetical protein